jgi:mono/diheme cytochrome c family protein
LRNALIPAAVALTMPAFCLAAAPVASGAQPSSEVLNKYCITCHNQHLKTAGLMLDSMGASDIPAHAEVWEKVIQKLRLRLMPPAGMPRPDEATYNSLIAWLETQLDRAAERNPQPGRPLLHRLNRSEYANAIRDLLALDVDAASLLPPDDSAYGFDNIADVLGVSPSLEQHYLSAALKVAALAIGDPNIAPGSETWRIRQDLSQDHHLDGMPLGTEGGLHVPYNFPLDGEYTFQARLYRTNLNIMRGLEAPHQVEFAVDGERILLASLGGAEDLASLFQKPTETGDAVDARLHARVRVKAGPHVVTAAFLADAQAAEPVRLEPYIRSSVDNFDWSGHPHLQQLTIAGPFNPSGPGDTPSRKRIFVCYPQTPQAETPCARQIVTTLVRRAYRQPPSHTDVERAMEFYETGRLQPAGASSHAAFESGIESALERVLASPKFLFRAERDPAGVAPDAVYSIGDIELASRLSFFLWSSIPDEELLRVASQRRLHSPAEFDRQVKRMLTDPRSEALTANFAGQWLELRNVPNVQPNSDEFPDFDDNLRQGFRRETELLFESIVQEDRSILDLLTADYTFVNERLARHYGIPGIYGSQFRRITIHDEARKGLLGQGSILALTSHATRTSPVVRGKWILENILGTPVPPPPPDVPPLKENQEGERPRTLREQMLAHRANAVCASCHKVMDPIGFALENFDAVGAWRTRDAGAPIDASGQLADGTKIDGVVALRNAIVRRPDVFAGTFTEKLLTYALGRGLDYRDMPAVRAIVRDAALHNYRFSAFISGVVHSTPFRMRMAAPETIETAQGR